MKRTPLKRKTPLKAKKSLNSGSIGVGGKNSTTGQIGGNKRKSKTPLDKLKTKLWKLCKNITRKQYGNICYTCGKGGLEGGNWQTGHYISSSICSTELRYHLTNLRPQCYNCNINKSGNWLAYEKHLLQDGINIEELKDLNEKTKNQMYREDWYQKKIEEYQTIFDELR